MLIYVGTPAAVIAVIYGLVYGGSMRGKRYRPGRPFASEPVWFLAAANPNASVTDSHAGDAHALTGGSADAESVPVGESSTESEWPEVIRTGETGGASDSW